MAARSSIRKATGCRSQPGANSVRKIATPSESGTAMSRARNDETRVPTMSGSAPNCSATGSQVLLVAKPNPNRSIASREPSQSSSTRNPSSSGTARAASVSRSRKTRSPTCRCSSGREGAGVGWRSADVVMARGVCPGAGPGPSPWGHGGVTAPGRPQKLVESMVRTPDTVSRASSAGCWRSQTTRQWVRGER